MAEAREELRWGMERRLEFIEFRLFWERKVNVWRAFLNYALKRLGLDMDPAAHQPHDQQIVLLSREAAQAVLVAHRDGGWG